MYVLKAIDRNIEKVILFISMLVLAFIVVLGVTQRFLFGYQIAWTGSLPIYFFLWVTWIGAAYNVKTRQQLRFSEIRSKLPPIGQLMLLMLDNIIWVAVACVVIYYAIEQVSIARDNFAIVQGTNDTPQWWFYLATPLGWGLIILRAVQNAIADVRAYRQGKPMDEFEAIFLAD